jgi:hypothetical protein
MMSNDEISRTCAHPKCLICGEVVDGIGELDVPYHVECMLKQIQTHQREDYKSRYLTREYDEG